LDSEHISVSPPRASWRTPLQASEHFLPMPRRCHCLGLSKNPSVCFVCVCVCVWVYGLGSMCVSVCVLIKVFSVSLDCTIIVRSRIACLKISCVRHGICSYLLANPYRIVLWSWKGGEISRGQMSKNFTSSSSSSCLASDSLERCNLPQ
jgi:hypothetical protein